MFAMAGPRLIPGCMIMWFEHDDEPSPALIGLVIQFEEYFGRNDGKCYTLSVIHGQVIKSLTLFDVDKDKFWRVVGTV